MNMRFLMALVLAFTLTSLSGASAQGNGQTIAQLLGNNDNFTLLEQAVRAADPQILNTLNDPSANLTFFAPTDAAFNDLPSFVVDYLRANPDLLTPLLRYHAVQGERLSTDIQQQVTQLTSLDRDNLLTISVVGDDLFVDQARIIQADIDASNGVIHVVNSVLVPPIELPTVNEGALAGPVRAAGNGSGQALTERIVAMFAEEIGAITYESSTVEATNDFETLCSAATDILSVNTVITGDDRTACVAAGYRPLGVAIGTDAVVVAVNPANSMVTDITLAELQTLFTTAVLWSDVRAGWPEEPIIRYVPDPQSTAFNFFAEQVTNGDRTVLVDTNTDTTFENVDVLIRGVELETYGVAFFNYDYYAQKAENLRLLEVAGVSPTLQTMTATTYPLARPITLYTTQEAVEASPYLRRFLNYTLTNVEEVATGLGYLAPDPFILNRQKLYALILLG